MQRMPFVLKFAHGESAAGIKALLAESEALCRALEIAEAANFSIWRIADFMFCYGEYPDGADALSCFHAVKRYSNAEPFAGPGELRLMYHDIGCVREDKSGLKHRVFATKLKKGCAEEYKRRHDALVEARGGKASTGATSNFTIWNAHCYIFGYSEIDPALLPVPTEAGKKAAAAWETKQLEIMDWLTDDVDWITGEKHEPAQLVWKSWNAGTQRKTR